MSTIYGYTRVSTQEQNDDRQIIALKNAGVDEGNIFADKQSGKNFNRPAYLRLKNTVQEGDKIIIKSLDRLGRNFDEIIEEWRIITSEKKVDIIILDMPFLLELSKLELLGKMISAIILYVMSYFAQVERDFMLSRQKEGIAAAKKRGVKFGRKEMPKPKGYEKVMAKWRTKKISGVQAAKKLGVSYPTFIKWAKADSTKIS